MTMNRRTVLKTAGQAAVVATIIAVPTAVVATARANPDATLLDLHRHWSALEDQWFDLEIDLEQREIDKPRWVDLPYVIHDGRKFYDRNEFDHDRARLVANADPASIDDAEIDRRLVGPGAEIARAAARSIFANMIANSQQKLVTFDAARPGLEADLAAVKQRSAVWLADRGIPALEDQQEANDWARQDILEKIRTIPAQTPAGLLAKFEIVIENEMSIDADAEDHQPLLDLLANLQQLAPEIEIGVFRRWERLKAARAEIERQAAAA